MEVMPPQQEISGKTIEALQSVVGNDLRAVITYKGDVFTEHYVRPDIDADYADEEIQAFIDDLSMQGLSRNHLESLFNTGSLHCTVLGFEEALMFHFVQDDYRGLFVTYDRTADSNISQLIQLCEDHIGSL